MIGSLAHVVIVLLISVVISQITVTTGCPPKGEHVLINCLVATYFLYQCYSVTAKLGSNVPIKVTPHLPGRSVGISSREDSSHELNCTQGSITNNRLGIGWA